MITVNKILTELYNSAELNNCINRYIKRDYREDFKHDLLLMLHDRYKDKIVHLYERHELNFYVARIIINASKSDRWFGGKVEELPDNLEVPDTFDINERLLFEEKEMALVSEVENLDEVFNSPFHRLLVKALANKESMSQLSRETGIPKATISRSVKVVREHLKSIQ